MWLVIAGLEVASLVWYLQETQGLSAKDKNFFTTNMIYLGSFSTHMMILQFAKEYLFEKYRYSYPLIAGHARETLDYSLERLTSAELTEKSKNLFKKLNIGMNINAVGYKAFHIETAKKMNYSLET